MLIWISIAKLLSKICAGAFLKEHLTNKNQYNPFYVQNAFIMNKMKYKKNGHLEGRLKLNDQKMLYYIIIDITTPLSQIVSTSAVVPFSTHTGS